jgi:hypothetical protein
MELKVPAPWTFVCVYTRERDGLRFEKTVYGEDRGRCEACLKVVVIAPPQDAEAHVCERWWENP